VKTESAALLKTAVSREFRHGDRTLIYRLQLSPRRTVAISVHPDRSILVSAPNRADDRDIERLLRKRFGWILKQQQDFEDMPPPVPPRQWVGGETHRYLGRQYRLKIAAGKPVDVRLKGRFFEITVPNPAQSKTVFRAMDHWYRTRAHELLNHRVDVCLDASRALDVPRPEVVVRAMTQRWGSCSPSGRILLNVDLVKLPLSCIDYVVTHELCHLKVRNHGPKFWRLVRRCDANWEQARKRLRAFEL
jgi:predicted metal-dependent hydrolase